MADTLRVRVDAFAASLGEMVPEHWRRATESGTHDLLPIFHILPRDGDQVVVGAPFDGDVSKDAVADFVRALARSKDAIAVAFISEVWLATPSDDPRMPSERPDRIEGVILSIETPYGCELTAWHIERAEGTAKLEQKFKDARVDGSRFWGAVEKLQ